MAIAIEGFHSDIRSVLKKYNSAFVSPEDIDKAINKSCIDILNIIIQEYKKSNGQFKTDQDLLLYHTFSGTATVRTLPSDVFQVSTVFIGEFEGDLLPDRVFNNRVNSVIVPPSATKPIATVYNLAGARTIQILPSSSDHRIKYWKNPTTCVYAFTVSSGVVTYNPTGSVDIDFPMSEYTRLFARALTYLAPSAKDPEAAQLEQNIIK
jgi:hypothetical protein